MGSASMNKMKNKPSPYLRRAPTYFTSSLRRSKRLILPVGLTLALFLVVTFQYHPPLNQFVVISENARDMLVPMSRVHNAFVPYSKNVSVESVTNATSVGKDEKDVAKNMINASSKTLYPLTLNAPYLIENPKLCSSVPNLTVLVIVHSAPNHFKRRLAIRKTWTNNTYFSDLGSVRVLFLLGRVKDIKLQEEIEEEFNHYGDLLQGDFIDAYRNLTHKGVMAYKWMTERCRNAKFILKVDDDITVNMYKLFTEVLPSYKGKTKEILCNHIHPGTMLIIRSKKSKWYVSENHFRGEKFYPRYCSGFMVLFTNDAIPAIYRSASLTPFFWVDDVYLYGLVPSHVPGIHYKSFKKNSHQLTGNLAVKCYRNATRTCDFLVTGAGEPAVMEEIWYNMGLLYLKARNTVIKMDTTPTTTTTTKASTSKSIEQKENKVSNESTSKVAAHNKQVQIAVV